MPNIASTSHHGMMRLPSETVGITQGMDSVIDSSHLYQWASNGDMTFVHGAE